MKKTKRFIAAILSIALVFSLVSVFVGCTKEEKTEEKTTASETTMESGLLIEEPDKETNTIVEEDGDIKKPETEKQTSLKKSETTTKKVISATQKQEKPTQKPETTTKKDVSQQTKPFSCTNKKHNCKTQNEHDFLVMLETKGCPICSSNSCVSFYAKDEWGNNCYDITKCPKYNEKKDPVVYCEYCSKPCGLGDNGTCVRFTTDTVCPDCGKKVNAKECHSH